MYNDSKHTEAANVLYIQSFTRQMSIWSATVWPHVFFMYINPHFYHCMVFFLLPGLCCVLACEIIYSVKLAYYPPSPTHLLHNSHKTREAFLKSPCPLFYVRQVMKSTWVAAGFMDRFRVKTTSQTTEGTSSMTAAVCKQTGSRVLTIFFPSFV